MDKSQQLFAHLDKAFGEVMVEESENRRPGVTAIYAEIRQAHPDWPDLKVATEAKIHWERLRRPKNQFGFSPSAVPFRAAERKEGV